MRKVCGVAAADSAAWLQQQPGSVPPLPLFQRFRLVAQPCERRWKAKAKAVRLHSACLEQLPAQWDRAQFLVARVRPFLPKAFIASLIPLSPCRIGCAVPIP